MLAFKKAGIGVEIFPGEHNMRVGMFGIHLTNIVTSLLLLKMIKVLVNFLVLSDTLLFKFFLLYGFLEGKFVFGQ